MVRPLTTFSTEETFAAFDASEVILVQRHDDGCIVFLKTGQDFLLPIDAENAVRKINAEREG